MWLISQQYAGSVIIMTLDEDCTGQHQTWKHAISVALSVICTIYAELKSTEPLEKMSVDTQTFNQRSMRCCEDLGRTRS